MGKKEENLTPLGPEGKIEVVETSIPKERQVRFQDSVFNQLIKVIPRYQFDRLADKYKADFRVRKLGCWELFLCLLYAQFTGRRSLRDLELNFNANRRHFYHLGCRSEIRRSTLADANNTRPAVLFEALFQWVVAMGLKGKQKSQADQMASLVDASTVVLNKTRFGWATGHKGKSGIKLHTVYDLDAEIPTYFEITEARKSDLTTAKKLTYESGRTYVCDRAYYDFQFWRDLDEAGCWFVIRLKKNSPTQIHRRRRVFKKDRHILSDNEVLLNQRMARSRKNPYNKPLREITVRVEGQKDPIRIVTNDLKSKARDIADLYKKRWQIELFFKWIKQNLKIKTFLGTSENAVKIQILVAMIAFILLRLLNRRPFFKDIPLLTLARLIETSLMRRISLLDLFVTPPPDPPHPATNSPQEVLGFA